MWMILYCIFTYIIVVKKITLDPLDHKRHTEKVLNYNLVLTKMVKVLVFLFIVVRILSMEDCIKSVF